MTGQASPAEGRDGTEPVNRDQLDRNLRLVTVAATREDRLVLLGQIGEAQRLLGHAREAEATLREAVELAGDLADRRAECANLIRLGGAVQQLNRHGEAVELLHHALLLAEAAAGAMTDLETLALQRLGGCLVEMGLREEAVEPYRRALALVTTVGDRARQATLEKALDALRAPR